MRPTQTLSLSPALSLGGVASARSWLPRRTGTVVMVAVLTLVDVLAVLLVLSVLGALAVLGPPSAAHSQSPNPPFAVFMGRANGTIISSNPTLSPVNSVLKRFSYTTASTGALTVLPLDTKW